MYHDITQKNTINTVVIMGDYLASIRVRTNSCRVQMVTIAISMIIFK